MKQILIILVFLNGVTQIYSQTWRQYNLWTGQTTNITFSYTSSATSNYNPGNKGILPENYSNDTIRNFSPSDIINDPNAYPWRTIVKFNDVTGFLIDPYHVLTAGHAIEFNSYFQYVIFMPGYENGNQPFGYAKAEYFYLLTDYSPGTSKDYAVVKLDRPIGALAGWNGYGYNTSNTYFQNNVFFSPSYPSQAPYDGEYLFNWKGNFSSVFSEYFLSSRTGTGGMSGSPVFKITNDGNIVYGILTNMGIKYNRITANKFDAINKIIETNTPVQFDLIPLCTKVTPKQIKSGTAPESLEFVLHNYSSENKSGANITANFYLSSDDNITSSDELIASYSYQKNINSKSSEHIIQTASMPVINKPAGEYYIGIIITGDNNTSNNTTKAQDVSKIVVTTDNLVSVKGRITSSQSGSGVHFVSLSGFPYETKTDYYGNYETCVPAGWSGTVTPLKAGYEFNNSGSVYTNLTESVTTNYIASKKSFLLSGNIKSPVAHQPVNNAKIAGLPGEPYTDFNGNFSVNVFYGWAGILIPSKSNNLVFSPYNQPVSNLTASVNADFSGGYYINGRTYDNGGSPISGVLLQGFPSAVTSNEYGEYSVFLDSGWTGRVTPTKENLTFNPEYRNYQNISVSLETEDYMRQQAAVLNLKVLLTGAMYENTDTMRTSLNYKSFISERPPDTLSGSGIPFVYVRGEYEGVNSKFFAAHRDIVDWIIIELRDSRDYSIPVDTITAFVRNDGRVLSMSGDTLIPLNDNILPDNYYIVIRHRNHLSIMSNNPVFLNSYTELYDFSSDISLYFGGDAHLLPNGKYGMFPGDADHNGEVNLLDYQVFNSQTISALNGYLFTDFNMDGYLTGSDFNTFAPENKKKRVTFVPPSIKGKIK